MAASPDDRKYSKEHEWLKLDGDTATIGTTRDGIAYVPRTASYAVIRDGNGRVAFARGQTHIWLVGGGAEQGESPEDTIKREALEEAGRELRIDGPIGTARQFFEVAN